VAKVQIVLEATTAEALAKIKDFQRGGHDAFAAVKSGDRRTAAREAGLGAREGFYVGLSLGRAVPTPRLRGRRGARTSGTGVRSTNPQFAQRDVVQRRVSSVSSE
jgi:hypothetical protein